MADYYWRNANNDQDGTDGANFDDGVGAPYASGNPPDVGDSVHYDGNEDNVGLPTSLTNNVDYVTVSSAYSVVDFTTFLPSSKTCNRFDIDAVTVQMSGTPVIPAGSILRAVNAATILDVANPITTAAACAINWMDGWLDILGGLDAAHTITHTNGAGSSITCDVTGNLNLGATADTGVDITVNGAITVTQTADVYVRDFTGTAGAWSNAGAYTIVASGDVVYTGMTGNATRVSMTGTGKTINWNTSANRLASLEIATGATVSASSTVRTGNFFGGGSLSLGSSPFQITTVTGAWWQFTGTMTSTTGVVEVLNVLTPPGGDIDIAAPIKFRSTVDRTIAMDGNLWCGDLTVVSTGVDKSMVLTMGAGKSVRVGDTLLGNTGGATGNGQITLASGTSNTFASIAAQDAANVGNALHLSSAYCECSGKADFTNIAHDTSGDDLVHMVFTAGGDIDQFDPATIVHVHGDASVDGINNNSVNAKATFNTHAPPGSLILMGAGV